MKKYFLAALILFTGRIFAATITVSSVAELQNAINAAKPGDLILVADGVYKTTTDITISSTGTASKPITIAAKNSWAADITGSAGFVLVSPAAYVIIKGFKFTHAASKARSAPG